MASQSIPEVEKKDLSGVDLNSFILNSWFSETNSLGDASLNHVNLLLTHLKNFRLTFAGLLNSGGTRGPYLLFDNIDLLTDPRSPSKKDSLLNFENNVYLSFEPFFFSCFNRKFFLYF